MAAAINFKKNEKLAILRIMIEINNYYSPSLPNASTFIQDVANYFETPNGIYSLTVSEAQDVLSNSIKSNKSKTDFLHNALNYILKDDKITARYENIEEKFKFSYDEKEKAIRELNNSFRSKWAYAVKLTKRFLNLQFIHQYNNPLEKYSSIKTTATKSITTQPTSIDSIGSLKITSKTVSRKAEDVNKILDFDTVKEELRKELKEFVRKELKEEIRKELDVIRNELREFIRKGINEELHKGMKNIVQENFSETLYKDL